jgi:hypothetical protein
LYEGRLYRLSFILYSRKSIGDYFVRRGQYGSAFDYLFGAFEEMRWCTSSIPLTSLLDSLSFEDLGDVRGSKIPPSLSPAIHHTIMAGTMLSLNEKLYLTLVEMHAVMMAFSAIAGAPFFVARAAKTEKDLPRGAALGYTLASVAITDWQAEGSGSQQPQRYNMYFKVASPVPPLDASSSPT